MKNTRVTRANAPKRYERLFMRQNNLREVIDFFFDLGDRQPAHKDVDIKKRNRDERYQERCCHLRIDAASTGTDDGLGMLCSKEVDRQIVDGDIDHTQKSEDSAKLRPLFTIRQ